MDVGERQEWESLGKGADCIMIKSDSNRQSPRDFKPLKGKRMIEAILVTESAHPDIEPCTSMYRIRIQAEKPLLGGLRVGASWACEEAIWSRCMDRLHESWGSRFRVMMLQAWMVLQTSADVIQAETSLINYFQCKGELVLQFIVSQCRKGLAFNSPRYFSKDVLVEKELQLRLSGFSDIHFLCGGSSQAGFYIQASALYIYATPYPVGFAVLEIPNRIRFLLKVGRKI
ncbi:hypothetical protein B0H14DRAFT_2617796 [Mycena olivaceomarginata]|nr:hypothetical protein B0H14DRAFT_2617796 [Mycena olivaceomarginata]